LTDAIRARVTVNIYKNMNTTIMKNMNEVITRGMLKEELIDAFSAFEERLMARLEPRFANIEARMDAGFADLTERLDAEQAFTSDMWDDFSTRLAVLEAK
jgi:hypothetical protein